MTTKLFYTWKGRVNQLKMDAYTHKTRMVGFNLCASGSKKVFSEGDPNGCTLVVPEAFEMHEHIMLHQGKFPECQL